MNGTNLVFHLGSALVLLSLLWFGVVCKQRLAFLTTVLVSNRRFLLEDLKKVMRLMCGALSIPFDSHAAPLANLTKIETKDLHILLTEFTPVRMRWGDGGSSRPKLSIWVMKVPPEKANFGRRLGESWQVDIDFIEKGKTNNA